MNGAGISGTGYAVSGSTFPVSLNPGASLTLQVTFDPKTAGASAGTLTISSNANPTTVSLSGTGVAAPVPQLTVSATSLSFGNVTVNSTATKAITLKSTGTAPVTVNGAGISGTGYAVSGSTFPVSLNPGASLTLQVTFDPKTTGTSAGTLTISSNANPTTTVSLSGTGVAAPVPQLTVSAYQSELWQRDGEQHGNRGHYAQVHWNGSGHGEWGRHLRNGLCGIGKHLPGVTESGSLADVAGDVRSQDRRSLRRNPHHQQQCQSDDAVSLSGTGVATPVPQLTVSATSLSFGNVTVNTHSNQDRHPQSYRNWSGHPHQRVCQRLRILHSSNSRAPQTESWPDSEFTDHLRSNG